MELTTLIFPIVQIFKHKRTVRETQQALADFDMRKFNPTSTSSGSLVTRSTDSKRGKMYSMETLEDCLASNYDSLQVYSSCMELNGENIIFLVKVINFRKQWHTTLSRSSEFSRAVLTMFRAALSIYVSLVHTDTASYPINIEGPIYAKLESIFGEATELVASRRRGSTSSTPISVVTPWDEPAGDASNASDDGFPMHAMPPKRTSTSNESREQIIALHDPTDPDDPLANFIVPDAFDEHSFDAAFQSIKYMVWSETWQRYMGWKRSSGPIA